jgi:hypothetical protein
MDVVGSDVIGQWVSLKEVPIVKKKGGRWVI